MTTEKKTLRHAAATAVAAAAAGGGSAAAAAGGVHLVEIKPSTVRPPHHFPPLPKAHAYTTPTAAHQYGHPPPAEPWVSLELEETVKH
jgi:hypothetical protein